MAPPNPDRCQRGASAVSLAPRQRPLKGFIFAFVWPNVSRINPSCVQERQLSDSFRLYTEHCLCLMKNMRQVFPCTSDAAITRFELMLR